MIDPYSIAAVGQGGGTRRICADKISGDCKAACRCHIDSVSRITRNNIWAYPQAASIGDVYTAQAVRGRSRASSVRSDEASIDIDVISGDTYAVAAEPIND